MTFKKSLWTSYGVMTVFVLLWVAVYEEVLARGMLLGRARVLALAPWQAVLVSALLFGLGHLPALQLAGAELGAPLVLRTVGLNMLASILFASAFVRHNLETAMLTHAGFHLGVAAAVLIL